jgi:hypothetical protein
MAARALTTLQRPFRSTLFIPRRHHRVEVDRTMFKQTHRIGMALGHACGIVGTMIVLDLGVALFQPSYLILFRYPPIAGGIIGMLMIVLGLRVVDENARRRQRGPWQRK